MSTVHRRVERLKVGTRSGSRQTIGEEFRRGRGWAVECECSICGKISVIDSRVIRAGATCRCNADYASDASTYEHHGMNGTRLYEIYRGMKQRCYTVTSPDYQRYGAKGVRICEEWLNSPKAFFDWALANGYADDLEIDRKRKENGYEPGNCQWITKSENSGKDQRELPLADARSIREDYSALCKMGKVAGAISELASFYKATRTAVQQILDGLTYKEAGGPIRTKEQLMSGRRQAVNVRWEKSRAAGKVTGNTITLDGHCHNQRTWAKIIGISPVSLSASIKRNGDPETTVRRLLAKYRKTPDGKDAA